MGKIAKNFMISNEVVKPSFYEISCVDDFLRADIVSVLEPVSHLYPNFRAWLNFRFMRGFSNGERKVLLAHDGSRVLGVSLLKLTDEEKKICTLFVSETARSAHNDMKIGTSLMLRSLALLDSDNVLITVCSEKHQDLKPLLHNCSFEQMKEVKNLYRDDSSEYFYRLK